MKDETTYNLRDMEKFPYDFDFEQLETESPKKVIFCLVASEGGGLFIYDVYVDNCQIGCAWSKSRKLIKTKNFLEGFKYSNEETPAFFYSISKPCRNEIDALKLSETKGDIYIFDEFWWPEGQCGDVWFPTFDTLDQLINFHFSFNKKDIKI